MTTIGTLNVKFTADTSGLKQGAGQAKGILAQMQSGVSSFTGGLSALSGGFFKTIAPALIAGGAAAYKFAESANRLEKMADVSNRTGIAMRNLQIATIAAGNAGVEFETLTKAIDHMSKTIGSGGMSLDARFAQQAKRIGEIADPAKRAAEAMKVFGKSGAEMLPFLMNIGQEMEHARKLIDKFNFGLTEMDKGSVKAMKSAWQDFTTIAGGWIDKFVASSAPAIATFLEEILVLWEQSATAMGELGFTWEWVSDMMIGGFATLLTGATAFAGTWGQVAAAIEMAAAEYKYFSALMSGDKAMEQIARGDFMAALERGQKAQKQIADALTGQTAMDFIGKATSRQDGKGGAFGAEGMEAKSQPLGKVGAALFNSMEAAKIIIGHGNNNPALIAANQLKAQEKGNALVAEMVAILRRGPIVLAEGAL